MQNITQLSPLAEVISIKEGGEDKNGNSFRTLRLRGLSESIREVNGISVRVKSRTKEVSMNQWEDSYLTPGTADPFYDANVGDFLAVGIYRADVEPYDIIDNTTGEVNEVSSYTFPVHEGDNPSTVLSSAGHTLADNSHSNPDTTIKEGTMADVVDEDVSITV
jgi:hypothetical protein